MIQALRASGLGIAEALRRLEAEAEHGTFVTSRYRGKYVSWGDGPALIFLHGLADSIDAATQGKLETLAVVIGEGGDTEIYPREIETLARTQFAPNRHRTMHFLALNLINQKLY